MTADMLIEEGRRLIRPCRFLRPQRNGLVAAIWHARDEEEIDETGYRCWITVDSRFISGLPESVKGFISLFTNETDCVGGRIEICAEPTRPGIPLFATDEQVLPPLEVVFVRGSEEVGRWLADNQWPRNERYNDNFGDCQVTERYLGEWMNVYPLYLQDGPFAVLGGWHFPNADDDWYDLLDQHLLVLTLHDSEPWVEGWCTTSGEFNVIQRIT